MHTTGELEEQLRKRLRVESIIWASATGLVAITATIVRKDLYANPSTMWTVPPGRYTLKVWHERLGTAAREVIVTAGGSVEAEVEMRVGSR